MTYKVHGFRDGQILSATPLNEMDEEIKKNSYNMIISSNVPSSNYKLWVDTSDIVPPTMPTTISQMFNEIRNSHAKYLYNIGDSLELNISPTTTTHYDVMDFGNAELEDGSVVDAMYMQFHSSIGNGMNLCSQEALFTVGDSGLSAGTYHFTIDCNTFVSSENGKVYQFTTTSDHLSGEQFLLNFGSRNSTLNGTQGKFYKHNKSTTVTETVTFSEGNSGTDLGITNGLGDLNNYVCAMVGRSDWKTSDIRMFLNSFTTVKGDWWVSQNKWSHAPSNYKDFAGFLSTLNSEFVGNLKKVKVVSATTKAKSILNKAITVLDGHIDVTYDYLFLPSLQEMNIIADFENVEGRTWKYYKNISKDNVDYETNSAKEFKHYKKYPLLNKLYKLKTDEYQGCAIRSCVYSDVGTIWQISNNGTVGNVALNVAKYHITPAFVIC